MLEDLGNCVKIHDTVIPAVNIQVDPQEIFRYDHEIGMWIGLYFEVMFENGSLWVVTQEWPDDPIKVDRFPNWHKVNQPGQHFIDQSDLGITLKDWDDFLTFYRIRVKSINLFRSINWNRLNKKMAA